MSYSQTEVDISSTSTNEINSLTLGFYGYKAHSSGDYSTFSFSYTDNDISTSRIIFSNIIKSDDIKGNVFNIGYTYTQQLNLTYDRYLLGILGFNYTSSSVDDFSENGTFSSTISETDAEVFNVRMGLLYSKNISTRSLYSLDLKINVEWLYNLLDTDRNVTSNLNIGGDSFTVRGGDDDENLFRFGFSWELRKNNFVYNFGYDINFNNILENHSISAKISYFY